MASDDIRQLGRYQRARRQILAALLFVSFAVLLFTSSSHGEMMHERIETIGLALILIGIGGRLWATLYIGGRKAMQVVTTGPYSITRNPLYLFSTIAAAGVGAQTGSSVVAVLFMVITAAAFNVVAMREERYLSQSFGADYLAYVDRVPRFLPDPRLYRDDPEVTFQTRRFGVTLADGLVFLAAIPLLEAIEYAQQTGLVPVLFLLP